MTSNHGYRGGIKVAVTVLAVQVVLGLPVSVKAESAIAGASVLIMAQPSFLGALSSFNINITKVKVAKVTINALPKPNFSANYFSNLGGNQTTQPAVFSISGVPDQSFSIVMPQPGITLTAGGSFKFLNFKHNAGSTPTINSNGSKVFAVGALVKFTPFPTVPLGGSATGVGGNKKTSGNKLVKKTPAEKDLIPRPNPFGIQGVKDGFLNVLIVYN